MAEETFSKIKAFFRRISKPKMKSWDSAKSLSDNNDSHSKRKINIFIRGIPGKKAFALSYPSSQASTLTYQDVFIDIHERLGWTEPKDVYLTGPGSRVPRITELVFPDGLVSNNSTIQLHFRLRGGKGGFGANLRSAGGRMSSQKTTNFDACRDLSGRRLKTIKDAEALSEYLKLEEEKKKQQEELRMKKIEEGLKEPEQKKVLFDDTKFVEEHEKQVGQVKNAVYKALKKGLKGNANGSSSSNVKANGNGSTTKNNTQKRKLGVWDEDLGSSDEDSDNDNEDNSGSSSNDKEDEKQQDKKGKGKATTKDTGKKKAKVDSDE